MSFQEIHNQTATTIQMSQTIQRGIVHGAKWIFGMDYPRRIVRLPQVWNLRQQTEKHHLFASKIAMSARIHNDKNMEILSRNSCVARREREGDWGYLPKGEE